MNQARLLHPGSFTKSSPKCRDTACMFQSIAGDPSAKRGPQDDSVGLTVRYRQHFSAAGEAMHVQNRFPAGRRRLLQARHHAFVQAFLMLCL